MWNYETARITNQNKIIMTTNHQTKSAVRTDNNYARVQPQAVEVEKAVLGALMIDKNAFDTISNMLRLTVSMTQGIRRRFLPFWNCHRRIIRLMYCL